MDLYKKTEINGDKNNLDTACVTCKGDWYVCATMIDAPIKDQLGRLFDIFWYYFELHIKSLPGNVWIIQTFCTNASFQCLEVPKIANIAFWTRCCKPDFKPGLWFNLWSTPSGAQRNHRANSRQKKGWKCLQYALNNFWCTFENASGLSNCAKCSKKNLFETKIIQSCIRYLYIFETVKSKAKYLNHLNDI